MRIHPFFSIPLKELLLLQQGVMGGEKKAFWNNGDCSVHELPSGNEAPAPEAATGNPVCCLSHSLSSSGPTPTPAAPLRPSLLSPMVLGLLCFLPTSHFQYRVWLAPSTCSSQPFKKVIFIAPSQTEPLFLEMCTVSFLSQP